MFKSITLTDTYKFLENNLNLNFKGIMNVVEFLIVLTIIPLSFLVNNYLFFPNTSLAINIYDVGIYSVLFFFLWFVLYHLTSIALLPKGQRHLSTAIIFFRSYFIIFTGLVLAKFLLNLQSISITLILIHFNLSFFVTLGLRILAMQQLRSYHIKKYNMRNVVVIGDACSDQIIDKFINENQWGFNVRAIITKSNFIKTKYGNEIPTLAGTENLSYILESQVVDEVLYCKKRIDRSEVRRISQLSNEIGVVFRIQKNVSPNKNEDLSFKTLNEVGKLTLVDIPARRWSLDLKNALDVFSSSVALLMLSPFLLVIAAIIKLTSKGPVFFAQERVGLRGRKFKLFKFRTMVVDAEELLEKLKSQNEMDGPTFKLKDDPRITKVGKFLRKTGLDELPQLYNVVLGEMSLIGPRPPLESEVMQYERWQLRRLSVKPGITCTWQIMPNRNDIKFERWMRMDLNYIDNWSFSKDIGLIFKTISSMIFATGR